MEEIVFMVKGSSSEPYQVTFKKNGVQIINAFCTCRAGMYGQHCKHRLAIMAGVDAAIVSGNQAKVLVVNSWLAGSNLEEPLTELVEAEQEYEAAKERLNTAKKSIAIAMHG